MLPDIRIERVVVTGGRGFTDYNRIEADLRALLPCGLRRVAEGASNGGGADWLARDAWRSLTGRPTERYQVRGAIDGRHRGAPKRRNARMVEAELQLAQDADEALLVLAYPDPESRGTWDCVRQALQRGIVVAVWAPWAAAWQVADHSLAIDDQPRFILKNARAQAQTQLNLDRLAEVLRG